MIDGSVGSNEWFLNLKKVEFDSKKKLFNYRQQ